MKEISIGVLIPVSGILPMGKQFDKSLRKALSEELDESEYEIEILTEVVGQGTPPLIEKALDTFFGYHDVDIVCGLCSNKAIEGSVERFGKKKVPLLLNNLGEHLIPSVGYNEYTLVNSKHLWQHCWAMGHYAAKNLGKKGLILGAMFDAGFAFITSFQNGLMSVDENFDFDLRLIPMPQPGELSQISEGFESVKWDEYDFVFPLFCGEEATIFIEEYHKRGIQTSIVGLPYILEMGEEKLEGLEVISTVPQSQKDDVLWRNVFSKMGENSGRAVAQALIESSGKLDSESLRKALNSIDSSIEYDSTQLPRVQEKIKVVKHSIGVDNEINSQELALMEVDIKDDEKMNEVRNSVTSSWMNSYLAV